jgi:hypothetical protein
MKPSLDDLIEQALKLPPGPKAWAPIFEHYPELTPEVLAQRFSGVGRARLPRS